MKRLLLLALTLGFLSSCVSRKQLTYLQETEAQKGKTYKPTAPKYKVQPNDILNINIRSFDAEESDLFNLATSNVNLNLGDLLFYLNGYTVKPDGNIEMPIIGEINVSGMNVDEIELLIESKLKGFFNEGFVHVSVQLAGVRFSVIGDVTRAGKYVIYQNEVNIFEALAIAGDISIVGNRREVQIIRQENSEIRVIDVDLTNSDILNSPDFFIRPNDIINVKPLAVKSVGIGETGFGTLAAVLGVLASTATLVLSIYTINNN